MQYNLKLMFQDLPPNRWVSPVIYPSGTEIRSAEMEANGIVEPVLVTETRLRTVIILIRLLILSAPPLPTLEKSPKILDRVYPMMPRLRFPPCLAWPALRDAEEGNETA
jgi:hypothetical protein